MTKGTWGHFPRGQGAACGRALTPAFKLLAVSRSLNGATDIQEFPDLKGTTSLETL